MRGGALYVGGHQHHPAFLTLNPQTSTLNQMQNDTLFGQRVLTVTFEDGRTAEMTIKQFRLKQYQQAFPLLDDELGLVALGAGVARGIIEALHPKSFEAAYAALKEVNADGFFIWSARQMERGAASMKNLPPELLEKVIAQSQRRSPLLPPSPLSPPAAA